jgi:glycosyltransferase involved in cell wall biosynthesis
MKKHRIVLASVLKPVNDTRMYEKMGRSLSKIPNCEIHIIGFNASEENITSFCTLHPMGSFKRTSLKRLIGRLKIFKEILQVKPKVLIVNTHELLGVALLNRILFGTRIIYDVQENYWQNIIWTDAFPKILRTLIALAVRIKEVCLSPFFNLFILAEKAYEKELTFISKKYIIIENKSLLPIGFKRTGTPTKRRLLFSGTLDESTGVFNAIEFVTSLHKLDDRISLIIIGYCSRPIVFQKIKNLLRDKGFITIIGGDKLVSHDSIVHEIALSDFGVISYPLSPHLIDKKPTKLFEYIHSQLPIILQNHEPWNELSSKWKAAIVVDFSNYEASDILNKMDNTLFYPDTPQDVDWSGEEIKLLKEVNKYF